MKLLLDKNADIESKTLWPTPLSFAAENGHETVVKLLLDKNADVEPLRITMASATLISCRERSRGDNETTA